MGGSEVVVGGWAAHEATRRQARWEANPHSKMAEPLSRYGGRTYVSGQDALESLLGARTEIEGGSLARAAEILDKEFKGGAARAAGRRDAEFASFDATVSRADPLTRAGERLARALERFDTEVGRGGASTAWQRLGVPPDSPFAITTLDATDIRRSVSETDVHELHRCGEDAGIFAASYARADERPALHPPRPPRALPLLPAREVEIPQAAPQAAHGDASVRRGATPQATHGDASVGRGATAREGANREIIRLEAATVPRAEAVGAYRAEIAAVYDAAAEVLERAVRARA
jgi:hypothetical protein